MRKLCLEQFLFFRIVSSFVCSGLTYGVVVESLFILFAVGLRCVVMCSVQRVAGKESFYVSRSHMK